MVNVKKIFEDDRVARSSLLVVVMIDGRGSLIPGVFFRCIQVDDGV